MIEENTTAPYWSIGLMTGTVLDGNIDIAMVRTDGETIAEYGPSVLAPCDRALVTLLNKTLSAARDWQFEGPEPDIFRKAEIDLTKEQAAAVRQLVGDSGMHMEEIGIIGFHGQSVLHRRPADGKKGQTRQLGDGQLMADLLGVPVAWDFRSKDVDAGGQGAPLAPVYHSALLRQIGANSDTAVLNMGGVSNITWWDGDRGVAAFDTGPANAPLNDFVGACGLGKMDKNGELAARGLVDESRLLELLNHPYFDAPYPKSLDRFDFSSAMAAGCTPEAGAALLTAFTAATVGKGLDLLPVRPKRLIVSGGGRHNPTLMRELEHRAGVEVAAAESVGWNGDMVEAECFAFLAMRTRRGLPISYPTTTGVAEPMTGGVVSHPRPRP